MVSRGLSAGVLGSARYLNITSASIQHNCDYKLPLQHECKTSGCAEVAGDGKSVFRLRNFHSFYEQFYLGLRCPLQTRWGVPELSPESTPCCRTGARRHRSALSYSCTRMQETTAFLPHSPVPLGKQIVFGQAHFFLKGPSLDSEIRGNGQLAASQLSVGHAD